MKQRRFLGFGGGDLQETGLVVLSIIKLMYNLVVDIGNTFSKMAVFSGRKLLEFKTAVAATPAEVLPWLTTYPIANAIVSSVAEEPAELRIFLEKNCKYWRFSSELDGGVRNLYKTPSTLGLDRYAAVVGAYALNPGANSLVIDAGTCITYDFINREGAYYGGSISPGIRMRLKSMNTFTGRLPLIDFDPDFNKDYGDDTAGAMLSGVANGVVYEAIGFIQQYEQKWPGLHVVLCGGDFNFFDRQLKSSIFAGNVKVEPHLVLIGLNEVIHHNEQIF